MPLTMFLYFFTFLDKYAIYHLPANVRMSTKDLNQVETTTGKDTSTQRDFYIIQALYYAGYPIFDSLF